MPSLGKSKRKSTKDINMVLGGNVRYFGRSINNIQDGTSDNPKDKFYPLGFQTIHHDFGVAF
jgi:hypothetical protein